VTQTVGSYLVDLMIRSGVRNICGIVGDSANPVIDAIRKSQGGLEFINGRNEEAGAFAAASCEFPTIDAFRARFKRQFQPASAV
jgi:thiamine pyrophosphate-dependent acetolactate synthase large subunit-like protein